VSSAVLVGFGLHKPVYIRWLNGFQREPMFYQEPEEPLCRSHVIHDHPWAMAQCVQVLLKSREDG
jgi:hypothetical protein